MSRFLVAKNRKAQRNYELLGRFEAGIVLQGTEVKALREGKLSLNDSYGRIKDGEVWLENCHISAYSHATSGSHEPVRPRKLLLHRREIRKLLGKTAQRGYTIVPLSVYFKDGKAKVEIALARGRRLYNKREVARRRTIDREVRAELKGRLK